MIGNTFHAAIGDFGIGTRTQPIFTQSQLNQDAELAALSARRWTISLPH